MPANTQATLLKMRNSTHMALLRELEHLLASLETGKGRMCLEVSNSSGRTSSPSTLEPALLMRSAELWLHSNKGIFM